MISSLYMGARFRRWAGLASFAVVSAVASTACGVLDTFEVPDIEEEISEEEFEEFVDDVREILRELFPKLSDAEIDAIVTSLSYDEIVALRDELEAAREEAAAFSLELFQTAEERVEQRTEELAAHNDGFPETVEPVGRACFYDAETGLARCSLAGVFSDTAPIQLDGSQVTVRVDGVEQQGELQCLAGDETVDIVFLIDITGSMSNVIDSVRNSVVSFVDAIEASGLQGTISVVSFQDTVGVDVSFQEPAPAEGYERSPFFKPVDLRSASGVQSARDFINRLEANRGADAPENLAGAIDFARSSVIGGTAGSPKIVDGQSGPTGTRPFPALTSDRQVFVALTDSTFHADDRSALNSSLEAAFEPRDAQVILRTLQKTGTVVHVIDPSWRDATLMTSGPEDVDADYWAIHTGGLGEDTVIGYSLVDLELVVVAETTGLLDIALDGILSTSCAYTFAADLGATATVELELNVGDESFTDDVDVVQL